MKKQKNIQKRQKKAETQSQSVDGKKLTQPGNGAQPRKRSDTDAWSLGELEALREELKKIPAKYDLSFDDEPDGEIDEENVNDEQSSLLGRIFKAICILVIVVAGTVFIVYNNTEGRKQAIQDEMNIINSRDNLTASNRTITTEQIEKINENEPINDIQKLIQTPEKVLGMLESSSSKSSVKIMGISSSSKLSSATSSSLISSNLSSVISARPSSDIKKSSISIVSSTKSEVSEATGESSITKQASTSSAIVKTESSNVSTTSSAMKIEHKTAIPDFSDVVVQGNVIILSATGNALTSNDIVTRDDVGTLKWRILLSATSPVNDKRFADYLKMHAILSIVDDSSLQIIKTLEPVVSEFPDENNLRAVVLSGLFSHLSNGLKAGNYSIVFSIGKRVISTVHLAIDEGKQTQPMSPFGEVAVKHTGTDSIVNENLVLPTLPDNDVILSTLPAQNFDMYSGVIKGVNKFGGNSERTITLNIVFNDDASISGEANVSGIGQMAIRGKNLQRGFEIYLTAGGQNIKLTGARYPTMLRGRFVSGSLEEVGNWEVSK